MHSHASSLTFNAEGFFTYFATKSFILLSTRIFLMYIVSWTLCIVVNWKTLSTVGFRQVWLHYDWFYCEFSRSSKYKECCENLLYEEQGSTFHVFVCRGANFIPWNTKIIVGLEIFLYWIVEWNSHSVSETILSITLCNLFSDYLKSPLSSLKFEQFYFSWDHWRIA